MRRKIVQYESNSKALAPDLLCDTLNEQILIYELATYKQKGLLLETRDPLQDRDSMLKEGPP